MDAKTTFESKETNEVPAGEKPENKQVPRVNNNVLSPQEEVMLLISFSKKVDKYFQPEKRQQLQEAVEKMRNESLASFDTLDLMKTYNNLFEILWYSQVVGQIIQVQQVIF